VRVVQLCGGLDLPQESLLTQRRAEVLVQYLDRHLAIMPNVVGQEHRGHSAHADLTLDHVAIRRESPLNAG
jgi:hypothetical protein